MPPLGAAREIALGTIGGDEFEAVQDAFHILQRHDEPASSIRAKGERHDLLGEKIGMINRSSLRIFPDAGCPLRGTFASRLLVAQVTGRTPGDRRRAEKGFGLTRYVRNVSIIRQSHTDAAGDPFVGVAPADPQMMCNEIGESTALPHLVIEPEPCPAAGDHQRQAALAAPAPFLRCAKARLPEQFERKLSHPGANLAVECLPVAAAHRACPATCAPACSCRIVRRQWQAARYWYEAVRQGGAGPDL